MFHLVKQLLYYQVLLKRQKIIDESNGNCKFLVVFSTYQSIDVIIQAQKSGFYEFANFYFSAFCTEFAISISSFLPMLELIIII